MAKKKKPNRSHLPKGLEILYEDDAMLVVEKPAGMLTEKTPTEKIRTVHAALTDYVKKGTLKSRNQVFTVHRLDQWTSGVLVFAKSWEIKDRLQDCWKETQKKYITVVHGQMTPPEDTVTSYLAETSTFLVYSTPDKTKGKLAQTRYKVLLQTALFSLLEIVLLTGRKNQIRVHMADRGHPIVGDRKYGNPNDGFDRLSLHAKSIAFKHPVTGEPLIFETSVPPYFKDIMAAKK